MKISLEQLKNRNYDKTGIGNYKLVDGICIKCNCKFEYSQVKKFLKYRTNRSDKSELWDTCQKCWHKVQTAEDVTWVQKNREAQLISQNKPEQKIKNAKGVSNSWTEERKQAASIYLKNRWQNDKNFADAARENLSEWNLSPKQTRVKKTFGTGGLQGSYLNINYDSALELSFIIWCFENHIKIKNYDLEPIPYTAEDNKNRLYIPDFIIEDNIIIEIKGYGIYYKINKDRNILKDKAVKNFTQEKKLKYRMIIEGEEEVRKNYRKARTIHHENYK